MPPYRALSVPVSLLHQKVYPTSHRLAAWEGLPVKAPVVAIVSPVVTKATGVRYTTYSGRKMSLFQLQPYLRRFFILVDFDERVMCRNCGDVAVNISERGKHLDCYKAVNQTLKNLVTEGSCAVCNKQIDHMKVRDEYNDVPVCSDTCMDTWERMIPDAFEEELATVKTIMEMEEDEKKANPMTNIRQFFKQKDPS